MMTKSPAAKSVQTQLWKPLLSDLVNPKHELVLLPGPSTGRASRPSWNPPTRRTTAVRRVRSGCSRGKARKRYEFGVKTGLVTSARSCWILGAQTFPGNPYDGHTLQLSLEQAERITGVAPKQACADLGYRKSGYDGSCDIQIVNRFRKTPDRSLLRWWKRRSAIEPVIGHVREDHSREGRCRLAGRQGDALHALLTAVGFNLRKLMKGLKRLFLCLFPRPRPMAWPAPSQAA